MQLPIVLAVALGATFLACARIAHATADLLVGVVEDVPATAAAERPRARVRVAFRHTAAGGWEAFPSDCLSDECLARIAAKYPTRTSWTVSLAGLTLGNVVGRTPAAFASSEQVGLQEIVSKGAVPAVGRATIEYAMAVGEPVHRPLLATSGVLRPQRSRSLWKEDVPEAEDLDRVWPAFRRLVPLIDNCQPTAAASQDTAVAADAAAETPADAAVPPGRHPRKLDLEIPAVWIARNGDTLLRVMVRRDLYKECDGPRAYPGQLWFYRHAQGRVRALPGQLTEDRSDLVAPLEFVDLLRDGHDEVLFQAAGHDRGGYVLYLNQFRDSVRYQWAYH
jgi:hypothetical protein